MRSANKKYVEPVLHALFFAAVVTFIIWWTDTEPIVPLATVVKKPPKIPEIVNIFADRYPNNPDFVSELALLKAQGKLKEANEIQIRSTIKKISPILSIPPALLYCLLFQESRLNHLSGIDTNENALGLGQFSYYSFFEVNNQISHYTPQNIYAMKEMLGYDVRPIEASESNISHPSSYYHIPTAVVASSIYLNNRFLHLEKLITKRQIPFDKNLLWVLAAMAYNKGTRSVLSLWNETERKKGPEALKALLSNQKLFFATLANETILTDSLKRIWSNGDATGYAKEWAIHAHNITKCSVLSEKGTDL